MQTNEKQRINRESSVRWQGRTIEQFGYALNLVLGLSVTGFGYETTLLFNKEPVLSEWQSCLLKTSLLLFFISSAVALWCIITRLRNFRLTAKIARNREGGASELELQPERIKSKELGRITWLLLWWQIGGFAAGIVTLFLVVITSVR